MRHFLIGILSFLLIFSTSAPVYAQTTAVTVPTNLSLGSYGPSVMALQVLLNQDPETQVAQSGAGSPGNETEYFGALTRAAVMRFQQKYATVVLAPVGLTAPNGYVGFYTRTKLNTIVCHNNCFVNTIHPIAPGSSTLPLQTPSSSTSTSTIGGSDFQNNIHPIAPETPITSTTTKSQIFLNDIIAAATAQGLSSKAIEVIRNEISKQSASTTDLTTSILQQFQRTQTQPTSLSFTGTLLKAVDTITHLFEPSQALAATGVSFGGTLIFGELICNEETQYLIEITPGPPSYAVFLTYTPGSQLYSAYNIPFTQQILGSYLPGAGVCVIGQCPYCYPFQTSGLITPQVGSTLVP